VLLLTALVTETGTRLGADFWLSYWSTHLGEHSVGYFLGIYAGLSLLSCAFSYARSMAINYGGINAAKKLHDQMLLRGNVTLK
jgi:hypothetical protein